MAARTAQEYNASDIAKDIEADPKTVDKKKRKIDLLIVIRI